MDDKPEIQQVDSLDNDSDEGYRLLEQKEWKKAIAFFEQKPSPISVDQFYQSAFNKYQGFALKQLNRYNEAKSLINEALKQNSKLYDYILKQQQEKLTINPKNVMALIFQGIALIELNKKCEADKVFSEALKLDPGFAYIYVLKSNNLWQLDKVKEQIFGLEEEIYLIDKAIELNPTCSLAYLNKGVFLSEKQLYDEAVECYDMALQFDETFSDAYFNKGVALIDQQKFGEAIECFQKVIKFNPNSKEAHQNLGDCLMELYRYDEAIQQFNIAIEIDKYDKDTYFCKAKCLQKQEIYLKATNQKEETISTKFDEINDLYKAALNIDQTFLEVLKNQGVLLDTHQKPLEALKLFNYAYQLDPYDGDTAQYIGQQLQRFNLFKQSLQSAKISVEELRGGQEIFQQIINLI